LQILWFDELPSTQLWLKEAYKNGKVTAPAVVCAKRQIAGIGSRGNGWVGCEGNLFASFVIPKENLPDDLKMESASIYFAYLLKETLCAMGSKVWIKWPNDFYIREKKVGGLITNIVADALIFGVGINLQEAPKSFGTLDISSDPKEIINNFVKKMENFISWKQVFRKYSVEFYKNKTFYTHTLKNNKVKMEDAVLNKDGSVTINGERIYSLR